MLEFIVGLAVGLMLLGLQRRRSDARLKHLLSRLEDRQPLPTLGYDAQLASAIAERQAQAKSMTEQLKDFRQVLQHAPVGYLQVDEENRLLWCNQRAQDFLDIEQSEYDQPRLLLAVVRSYELDQLVERTRQAQTICEARWTFNSISTDPSNYLERPAYPLQGYGLPISHGHVGVFLENRQEAVSLAQQRDRWISDVAHELKTPLTSIRLVAETLQTRVDPKLVSWVERLLKEVIRLSRLVDDVLNMSSLEQGRSPVEAVTEIDLVSLIQAAWQSLEPLASLKRVTLDYQGPAEMMAPGNADLMHRMFFNLMSNAVKYSPSAQAIQVRLSVATSPGAATLTTNLGILIEVIDAGAGLAEKDLPYVFDRFYRADPSRSRQSAAISDENSALEAGIAAGADSIEMAELSSSGTGLGLAIVRQIVDSYQGRVEARNSPDTGGGWLRVWLPQKRLTKPIA
ncbi:MAG: histidine kinase [Phormidesmis priestleyi]|uniref:histidine kinase n=1 Tax=Phormidesmis priestleyi TaxID=268141 RepID=A0A2W4XN51_9CYAN|nr:MAG: histidine kinase [Phormidesmis priestleyi]